MADRMEDRELRILAAVHQAELGAGATPWWCVLRQKKARAACASETINMMWQIILMLRWNSARR